MKIKYRPPLAVTLYMLSAASLVQANDYNKNTAQTLIHCYNALFALDIFTDSRFTSEERDLTEKMRTTFRRITLESELPKLANAAISDMTQEGYIAKITSDKFPAEKAQKEKEKLLSFCIPQLRKGEALPDAR